MDRGVPDIAAALVAGAKRFEETLGERMSSLRRRLTPVAVYMLNLYGRLRLQDRGAALHHGVVLGDAILGRGEEARRLVFDGAVRELLEKRLVCLDYSVADDGLDPDRFGVHATKLGLCFIRMTWPRSFAKLA
jgi:hypothetical protein